MWTIVIWFMVIGISTYIIKKIYDKIYNAILYKKLLKRLKDLIYLQAENWRGRIMFPKKDFLDYMENYTIKSKRQEIKFKEIMQKFEKECEEKMYISDLVRIRIDFFTIQMIRVVDDNVRLNDMLSTVEDNYRTYRAPNLWDVIRWDYEVKDKSKLIDDFLYVNVASAVSYFIVGGTKSRMWMTYPEYTIRWLYWLTFEKSFRKVMCGKKISKILDGIEETLESIN